MRRNLAMLLAAGLLGAACGSSGSPGTTTTQPSGGPTSGATDGASRSPTGTEQPMSPTTPSAPVPSAPVPSATTPSGSAPQVPSALVWTALADSGPEGPSARSDQTWTVDGDGQVAYLFGGTAADGPRDDLWAYDLAADSWSRLEPGGERPAARFGHVAAWVEGVGLVVWSGQAGSTFFNDLWAFDPVAGTWSRLPDGGEVPAPRYGSCGAVGPDGRLWISHGFTDSGRFDDTRAYDFAAGSWSEIAIGGERPIKRCLHDCFWSTSGRFLLYAGQTDGEPALGDLWALDPASGEWTREPRAEPEARQLYAVASLDGTAYVFGGADRQRQPLASLHTLDLSTLGWEAGDAAGDGPTPRLGATLVADTLGGRMILFGGRDAGGSSLGDLWELGVEG